MAPRSGATRRYFANSPFQAQADAPPPETYEVNDRVNHDRLGLGRVTATTEEAWVTVEFSSGIVRVPNDGKLCKL